MKKALALCLALACFAGSPAAAQTAQPLILLDGEPAALEAPALVQDGHLMVWVRDLARMVGGQVYLRSTDGAAVIRRNGAWTAFPVGKAEAEAPGRMIALPSAVILVGDKVMVPLEAACRALGVGCTVEQRIVAAVSRPGSSPSRGARLGSVSGRVAYNRKGASGVVLRLVRADGLTFVRGARAVSGPDGTYEFLGVAPGAYHVYAYIGDNPQYFNRQTSFVRVFGSAAAVEDLELGMVLHPLAPRPGAVVSAEQAMLLRWSECPEAAEYELAVADDKTGDSVFAVRTPEPHAAVPGERLIRGRTYTWRVTAHAADGAFLGSAPGSGAEPWTFAVR